MMAEFEKQAADFAVCEAIIKKASKTFYAAFSQLPQEKAWCIYAIYAFCRRADDLIDEDQNIAGLEKLQADLKRFEKNDIPDEPLWRALAVVFKHYPLSFAAFYDMLEGQRRDYSFQQPDTQVELLDYAYFVAGSVGIMLLPILSEDWQSIQPQGKKLGEAMQLTNILRDVGEDYQNGRIYLPKELMKKYHVTEKDLAAGVASENFIQLWEHEAQWAEAAYGESLTMLEKIDPDCREPLLLASYFYREILATARKNNYQVFLKKTKVPERRKLSLLLEVKKHLRGVVA